MRHDDSIQVPSLTVDKLFEGTAEMLALRWLAGRAGGGATIDQARIQKPGLALAGFVEYIHPGRVQVLGSSEVTYLEQTDPENLAKISRTLIGTGVSCFIVTKGLTPPRGFLDEADRVGVAVLGTATVSSAAIYALSHFLEEKLAPSVQRHAVLVDVYGEGVLLLGDSGVGKSECALDLIVRGHRIVSDDVVLISRRGDVLTGASPEMTRYHMEVRGIGIINVKDLFGVASVRQRKDIDLIIHLDPWTEGKQYDRLGVDEHTHEILGVSLPFIEMPVAPGRNLSVLVEVAARNHLLKQKGYHPARDLTNVVDRKARGDHTPEPEVPDSGPDSGGRDRRWGKSS